MTKSFDPSRTSQKTTPAARGSKKRILVVDDERDLADLVALNLQRDGYQTLVSYHGSEALDIAQRELPDLIVLDLMLPGTDGNEITRQLKSENATKSIPIVMLTAKSEETDQVVGLRLGADDYVTKPFSMKVLLARIATILRRGEAKPAGEGERLQAGPVSIDPIRHEVIVSGQSIHLTLTEFKLLSALVLARGRVLARDQLMDKAMGTDILVTDRAIDVHITAIRRKLGKANWIIHTVRGVGYRLRETNDEVEE
jgi:DNA-binding response OmpR family regulator